MIRTNDKLVACVVIKAFYKIVDVMSFYYMCSVSFTDKLSANLTTIILKQFEIVADFSVQLSDFHYSFIFKNFCIIIYSIEIKA